MTITDALAPVKRLFLDSAPVIYYFERHPQYLPVVDSFFDALDAETLSAVTSPVTLAECLILPVRAGNLELQREYVSVIASGPGIEFWVVSDREALQAAKLRAHYNLTLPDAFQIALAIAAGCDAFLTNDLTLKRVQELTILVLDELEPPAS